jgi:hypothetical protein
LDQTLDDTFKKVPSNQQGNEDFVKQNVFLLGVGTTKINYQKLVS